MMQGFEIDHKAFRASNRGRPAKHLIRELIQNAFDERPAMVRVTVEPVTDGRGLAVIVSDDGPGFKDEREIWTLFASGKRDDPTKRGRLGRGLKEIISVASHATVITSSRRTKFCWNGKTIIRSSRKVPNTTGTLVNAIVPSWKKADLPEIIDYLKRFIPPEGTTMLVNGVANERPIAEYVIDANIKTIVYGDGGVPNETWRRTKLALLRDLGIGKWIYEMGIPVEQIPDEDGFEWSVDVGQRTPIRPERDMLPRSYVHSIYAAVASQLMDRLPVAELADLWMEEAVGHYDFDKEKGAVYVERRFGANAARAVVNDVHDRNRRAAEDGVVVLKTDQLSASVRSLVRNALPSTADLYPVACPDARYVSEAEWTAGERRFVAFSRWLAARMNLPEPCVVIVDAPAAGCQADSAASATRIRINRSGLGGVFFSAPRLASWVPLVVHELAHRTGEGHDATFWREYERLAGEAAQTIRDNSDALEFFGL